MNPKVNIKCNHCIVVGIHTAVYYARPVEDDEGIVFTKIRTTKALENADQGQTKVHREIGSETMETMRSQSNISCFVKIDAFCITGQTQ